MFVDFILIDFMLVCGNILVGEDFFLIVILIVIVVSCLGEDDGSILLDVSGVGFIFDYQWSINGIGNINLVSGLLVGDVIVIVMDNGIGL